MQYSYNISDYCINRGITQIYSLLHIEHHAIGFVTLLVNRILVFFDSLSDSMILQNDMISPLRSI